jgi:7-cyano-7-deazaguanine synthase in queuosine biosynthesis
MSSTGAKDRDPMTAAFDYGEARRIQLCYRRQFSAHRCEERDDETPACYFGQESEIANWCPSCQQRQPKYREWIVARDRERNALRRLQKALVRAHEGR